FLSSGDLWAPLSHCGADRAKGLTCGNREDKTSSGAAVPSMPCAARTRSFRSIRGNRNRARFRVSFGPIVKGDCMSIESPSAEQAPTRREWLGLAVLSIGLGMIVLDGTIVGVALPV